MNPAGVLTSLLVCAVCIQAPVHADASTEVKVTPAEQQRMDECDRRHAELRQKNPGDVRALRDAWLAEKERCSGTGIYEYLLGYAERNAGDDAAAMQILDDAVRRKLPHWESSYVMVTTMRGEAAYKAQPPDLVRLRAIRDELEKFAAARRPDAFAYQQIAAASVSLKDWPAAIDAARKSIAVDRLGGRASRYLILALHESKRCPEAVKEIRPAVEANRELLANEDFMLHAADCYAEAGDPATGEAALNALLREKPALKDDPRVIQLQQYFAVKNHPEPAPK